MSFVEKFDKITNVKTCRFHKRIFLIKKSPALILYLLRKLNDVEEIFVNIFLFQHRPYFVISHIFAIFRNIYVDNASKLCHGNGIWEKTNYSQCVKLCQVYDFSGNISWSDCHLLSGGSGGSDSANISAIIYYIGRKEIPFFSFYHRLVIIIFVLFRDCYSGYSISLIALLGAVAIFLSFRWWLGKKHFIIFLLTDVNISGHSLNFLLSMRIVYFPIKGKWGVSDTKYILDYSSLWSSLTAPGYSWLWFRLHKGDLQIIFY